MQIFVRNLSGKVIPLVVPSDLSVQKLTTILSNQTPYPESDLHLVYAGRHLMSSQTLSTCNITPESTLHLACPLRGGAPPRKIRCSFKDCRDGAQRIVGDCGFCDGHFCAKHRLLEDHKCEGLEDVSETELQLVMMVIKELTSHLQCKKQSHERNAAQLHAERTHAIKGA
ncbi:Ubiquitin-60S ribosomal protein L40 [Golovinomyces cichoracearum]|uniref:Ubiquitin-60S ribosomal protein L40 n=1 Tax=Golovinomyces cichoracearum TaxID=62708 RepID=A0A420IQV6_9PEZI|nr:Ubiquitin-60S ribosomal protein L40 [Golovinomyces cichoracearum]